MKITLDFPKEGIQIQINLIGDSVIMISGNGHFVEKGTINQFIAAIERESKRRDSINT